MLELCPEELEAICNNTLLHVSRAYQTDILPENFTQLISYILAGNTSVTRFTFSKCLLNDSHIEALTTALKQDGRAVDVIDVSDGHITDRGLFMLLRLNTIREIDCSYNNITDAVVPEILTRDKNRPILIGLGAKDNISSENLWLIRNHFRVGNSEEDKNAPIFFSSAAVDIDSDEVGSEEKSQQQWCRIL